VTDQELVTILYESYRQQLEWFTQLRALMQKMLNTVILSGGDVSGIMEGLKQKQEILENITGRRLAVAAHEALWQQRKKDISESQAGRINAILSQLAVVVKDFLDGEEQIKMYIARRQQQAAP
jgi:hypothetical protein